jgi:hypothetical protein
MLISNSYSGLVSEPKQNRWPTQISFRWSDVPIAIPGLTSRIALPDPGNTIAVDTICARP